MPQDAGTVVACVGATGGVGTTRTAVELARLATTHDRRPLLVDTAVATQGLARLLPTTPRVDLCDALSDTDAVDLDAIAVAPSRLGSGLDLHRPAEASVPASAQSIVTGSPSRCRERVVPEGPSQSVWLCL